MNLNKEIYLDIDKNYYENISFVQGETGRNLIINILNNGAPLNLTGETVTLSLHKLDNTDGFFSIVENLSDLPNGKVAFNITSNALAIVGNIELELKILKSTSIIKSKIFTIEVTRSIENNTAIESVNEFTALNTLLAENNTLKNNLQVASTDLEKKFTTRLTAVENNKFDKTGGTITSSTKVDGFLQAGTGLAVSRGYLSLYPYSSTYDAEDNSYLQSYYDAKGKRLQINRKVQNSSSTDTDTSITVKIGGSTVVTTSGATFTGNITVPQLSLTSGAKLLMDSNNNLHLQGFTGNLYVNNKLVETNIGAKTTVTGYYTTQSITAYYKGNGYYDFNIFDSFNNAGATTTFTKNMELPATITEIDEYTIRAQNFDNAKSDSLFACTDITSITKDATTGRYTISIQFKNVSEYAKNVYLNINFIGKM